MKRFNVYMLSCVMALGLFSACSDDDDPDYTNINNPEIEAAAMSEQWINYLVAATSELQHDCVKLWAAWNGPTGVTQEEWDILGSDFFSKNNGSDFNLENGYAYQIKNPGPDNRNYKSAVAAIQGTIIEGCATIADEVGAQKIGGPNGYAKAGNLYQAVLEVESWYSWNSIKDYSDNIVSIRSSYFGAKGAKASNGSSLSDFVKSKDPELDAEVIDAINTAHTAILTMQAPFRNNLTGANVTAAIKACADLNTIFEEDVNQLMEGATYDFLPVLASYADNVVIPTYAEMKSDADKLHKAALAFQADPSNQSKLHAVCEAWRANRIPWEESEAFLIGPADIMGLDPSLDSWPLDQNDILDILKDSKLNTVEKIVGAIKGESVRGFHTIELLLFKDGKDRNVRSE